MIAKAALVLALTGLMAVPAAAASLDQELIAIERQSWVAWQEHDAAFFSRFLSDDHVEVQPGGVAGKAAVVAGVAAGCTVKSYALDSFKVTQLSADTALVVYRAAQDTTCGGAKVPSPVWASSVYVLRQGRWLNALYVHSPAG